MKGGMREREEDPRITHAETMEKTIEERRRSRLWNQGNLGIVRGVNLYHRAKWGRRADHELDQTFFKILQFECTRSETGIFKGDEVVV